MAIICNPSDIHLQCSATNFTTSQQPFSICVWVNATWNPGARKSFVGMYGPTSPTTALQFGTSAGNYDLTCWTWGGGTMVGTATGAMTGYNGVWTFLSYSYDGTTHRLYRDGIQLATSNTAQIPGTFNQVYINGYPTGGTAETADHQVDAYAYYNRTLTPDEMLTMANSRGSRHGITYGLLARFDFDEQPQGSNVASVVDVSGSANNLSLLGAGTQMTYTYINTVANANLRPNQ
jgi:hypothetical protein